MAKKMTAFEEVIAKAMVESEHSANVIRARIVESHDRVLASLDLEEAERTPSSSAVEAAAEGEFPPPRRRRRLRRSSPSEEAISIAAGIGIYEDYGDDEDEDEDVEDEEAQAIMAEAAATSRKIVRERVIERRNRVLENLALEEKITRETLRELLREFHRRISKCEGPARKGTKSSRSSTSRCDEK